MWVGLPRWSPDGKQIVFTATLPGKGLKTYLISAAGGAPQQITAEGRNEGDANWSRMVTRLFTGRPLPGQ